MSPAISSPKSSSDCLCPPFSASANSPHNGSPQSTAHSSEITKSSTPPPPPETQLQPYSSLMKNRTSCPRTKPTGLYRAAEIDVESVNYPPHVDFGLIIGSCNGLVCFDYKTTNVLIRNPIARKHHTTQTIIGELVKPLTANSRKTKLLRSAYGFGYDSKLLRSACMHALSFPPPITSKNSDHVPSDIFTQILLRLPVSTLLRFRKLSTQWWSTIDSPLFGNNQIEHSTPTTRNSTATLLILDEEQDILSKNYPTGLYRAAEIDVESVNYPPLVDSGLIIGSCNGLVCFDYKTTNVLIRNPITRKHHTTQTIIGELVKPLTANSRKTKLLRSAYGFGYDSDEYRVMYVTQTLIDGENCVESHVLNYGVSSDTSTVVKIPYQINAELNAEGVFVGPAIHWPAFRFNNSSGPLIIGFNLKSNKTKEIPLPEDARFKNPLQVGKLRDSLCIIDSCVGAYLDVWIMNNYVVKESWERLSRVERKQLMHVYSVRLLGFSMDSEHVLMQIDSQTLVWVDVKAKTMEEVEELYSLGHDSLDSLRFSMFQYLWDVSISAFTV
ncbi:F-box protein CPR1 [Linum perenne]